MAVEVRRRLDEWNHDGRIYHASDDPAKEELIAFTATAEEQMLVDRHTYLNLLWVYRNNLVHEFREPGYDMGVIGDVLYEHGERKGRRALGARVSHDVLRHACGARVGKSEEASRRERSRPVLVL